MTLYNYCHLSAMQSETKIFMKDCNSIYHLCSLTGKPKEDPHPIVDNSFIATVDDTILSGMNV